MLKLSGVHTYYGNIEALKGIDLEVKPGEIIALLGANGAGKTTTLSSISGLTPPKRGQVVFDGQSLAGQSPESIVARGLIQVPEGRHIFPELTVLENLKMGAYLRRDKKGIADDIDYVTSLFPILAKRAAQSGGTLSGGEQQMLAIGRGLMLDPEMLMFDEPSLGLAPVIVDEIFDLLVRIRGMGKTILLIEQNANMALEIADRGYVIETGKIALSGPARDLRDNPDVASAYLGI